MRHPIVNKKTNPSANRQAALYVILVPYNVASHLKILIPVGTAMIIVADVKYARVSTSIPILVALYKSRLLKRLIAQNKFFCLPIYVFIFLFPRCYH